jgi:DNA-binding CsgD family transcriptional regulator
MCFINSRYAVYFNKKYQRSGHLWQGRFRSWYVTDEGYLYTLLRYIENNPIKANISKNIGKYRYGSSYYFLNDENKLSCLNSSILYQLFATIEERKSFFDTLVNEQIMSEIKKASRLVEMPLTKEEKSLVELEKKFFEGQTLEERNEEIFQAYKEGYSQYKIAKILGVSQPAVSKIVKRLRGRK